MPVSPHARPEWTDEFGRNLFAARRRAGLTQESLAKFAGLHRTSIGLLELAHRTPGLDTICQLAKGLGITPSELIDGIGDGANRRNSNRG